MPAPTLVDPSGNQGLTQSQVSQMQQQSKAADLAVKLKQQVTGAMTAGWVILGLGAAGYMLSETRIFGPLLAIILALATIYQLNQFTQRKKA